jgi:hypothetical protein
VTIFKDSVAELHHFYAALIYKPALGEHFDAALFPQLRLLPYISPIKQRFLKTMYICQVWVLFSCGFKFLKFIHVKFQCLGRSSRSRMVLRLRLYENDASPCNSSSATNGKHTVTKFKVVVVVPALQGVASF